MRRLDSEDAQAAADWLDAYEGAPGDEANVVAMRRVAEWLRDLARDTAIKEAAREMGVPVKKVRALLRGVR